MTIQGSERSMVGRWIVGVAAMTVIMSGLPSPRSAAASSGAADATLTCFGEVATIVGTDDDDTLTGTLGRDVIVGLDGGDTIRGLAGDDLICAGDNTAVDNSEDIEYVDAVLGGLGNDRIDGGRGLDALYGEEGDDHLLLGHNQVMYVDDDHAHPQRGEGGAGDDVVVGGDRADRLEGGAGNDTLTAHGGQDWFEGGAGDDVLRGGAGRDQLSDDGGNDVLLGGAGPDYLFDFNDFNFDRPTTETETHDVLRGGRGDDYLANVSGPGSLSGGPGHDKLGGGPDAETVRGGSGADLLAGSGGDDDLVGGRGLDLVSFACSDGREECEDPVRVDLAAARATGQGKDTLQGIESVRGSDARDELLGDGNRNAFVVTPGDVIRGRAGSDAVVFEDINEWGETLGAVVDLAQDTARWRGVDTRIVSIERVVGTLLDDTLVGDGGRNVLFGWYGEDTIRGRGGDDLVAGELSPFKVPFLRHLRPPLDPRRGHGRDALFGGPGDDRMFGERFDDQLDGGSGRNHNDGGAGTDACVRPGPARSVDCETR